MPKPRIESYGTPAVDRCVAVVREYMHMPDTSPVFAALGCIAANYMKGPPVWLMLVSPPSSGKTQIIQSCIPMPFCREAGQAKNSSAFLTHSKSRGLGGMLSPPLKDEDGNEIGGIGDFGILLYTEFSNVLSLGPDQRDEVIAILRQIYDGRVVRQYGMDGGRVLEWEGKCGALGAVTAAIDDNVLSGDLGERWIYYRFPPSDIKAQADSVLYAHGEDPAERTAEFRQAIFDVFTEAKIEKDQKRRAFTDTERQRLAVLAAVACKLRGTVRRDRYTREITSHPQTEGAGRITNALAGMFLGMEKIGLIPKWSWQITHKIAVNSAPAMRLEVLRAIQDAEYLKKMDPKKSVATTDVTNLLKVSRKTGERYLEDLEKLDVIRMEGHEWTIDKKVREVLGNLKHESR